MELKRVDARLFRDARHLRCWSVDEYADREQASPGRGRASRGDARPRRGGTDLASRGRENEPDEIRPGGSGDRRMLRIAQTADLDDASSSEEPVQAFPNRY